MLDTGGGPVAVRALDRRHPVLSSALERSKASVAGVSRGGHRRATLRRATLGGRRAVRGCGSAWLPADDRFFAGAEGVCHVSQPGVEFRDTFGAPDVGARDGFARWGDCS